MSPQNDLGAGSPELWQSETGPERASILSLPWRWTEASRDPNRAPDRQDDSQAHGSPRMSADDYGLPTFAVEFADRASYEDFDAGAYFNDTGFGFGRLQQLAAEHLMDARD